MTIHEPALVASAILSAPPSLTVLTTDIVRAYVGNNEAGADQLPLLITSVHGALAGLSGEIAPAGPTLPEPVVSARASVKPDHVTCMDCGFKGKMLKRHLLQVHDLTPEQYRARWSLPADHALVAPNYAERRRELAKKIGLGTHPHAGRGRKPGGKVDG